jgi:dTDP-glucose 4,6-dehydratase
MEATHVVNFAAQGMVAESWLKPEDWYETNVVANVMLHDRLRKISSLQKYVHVGTPEVYGSTAGLIPESRNYNPSTPYAASRAACDLHLQTFIRQYNFPAVFTRAANVFGPGQQLYRIVPRTLLFLALGRKLGVSNERGLVRLGFQVDKPILLRRLYCGKHCIKDVEREVSARSVCSPFGDGVHRIQDT